MAALSSSHMEEAAAAAAAEAGGSKREGSVESRDRDHKLSKLSQLSKRPEKRKLWGSGGRRWWRRRRVS